MIAASMTRDHILREIKRMAETNGGIPLGRQRFATETGIKQTDWGKFWARWSDAVRESGLEPNKLQDAFSETMLLEKYAQLVRELGHPPTSAELRLKPHNDPEFPFATTFESRFGSKAKVINRVVGHFQNQAGFEDVVRLCKQYIAPASRTAEYNKATDTEMGYVYLSKSGRFFKIGKTNATGRREYELGVQLPEKVTTVHVISTDDPAGIEAYWHKRFASKRKKGECFQLTSADVSAFKRRKFM
jgi:Meiotically up-regulated gene 113